MGKVLIIKGADFSNVSVGESNIMVVASPSGSGRVTGGGLYASGDHVTLTAIANSGYSFSQWNDGNISNPREVIAGSTDITYTAYFVEGESKPSVDTEVQTTLYAENSIFDVKAEYIGSNIDTAISHTSFTNNYDIYKAQVEYSGAKYRINLNDNLNTDSSTDVYKFVTICDDNDNIIGYVYKRDVTTTGHGIKTFDFNMALFPGAAYMYISTYNDVISVTALAE